jgi:hypothetical protein
MITNYEKLFEPYTKDGHTLEATLKYLQKVANQRGISHDIMELAINEIFNDIANGKEFSKTKCSCGCGIDKAATDLIHSIRDRMLEIDSKKTMMFKDLLQQRYTNIIADQMHRINIADKEFIKMNRLPISERSPVLRFLKRVFKNGD